MVAVTAMAERIRFSAPLLLMLVGIGASFVPFIHEPALTTDIVLLGFLPPLLYATAIRSSVMDFRANWRPIGYLSILLVIVTAVGIGLVILQAILTALTPDMFDFAGQWSPLIYSLITALGAALAGYLKTDPARFTTHHTDPNLRAEGTGRHRAV